MVELITERYFIKQRNGKSPDIEVIHRHPKWVIYKRCQTEVVEEHKDKEAEV